MSVHEECFLYIYQYKSRQEIKKVFKHYLTKSYKDICVLVCTTLAS